MVRLFFDLRCIARRWFFERKLPFRPVSQLPLLVVAPHPDDETFGCAALISCKRRSGIAVDITFLTNGEASVGVGLDSPDVVAAIRRAQAMTACARLGVSEANIHWLNLPDGGIPGKTELGFDTVANTLSFQLQTLRVGEIACPHPNDVHGDHEAAAELVYEAVRKSGARWRVIHYPVWLWLRGRAGLSESLSTENAWKIDGTSARKVKKAAISIYLDAVERTMSGDPYCGRLPNGVLWNCRQSTEIFFGAIDDRFDKDPAQHEAGFGCSGGQRETATDADPAASA